MSAARKPVLNSGPKPTDLTKKKAAPKAEDTEIVNGDVPSAEENGVNGHNGHHVEGDEAEPTAMEA